MALKILKEITKSQTFDDSSQLLRLINRLQAELDILKEDLLLTKGQESRWKSNIHTDDTRRYSTSLQRRQEFICTCLRFMSYSIIRMDPNVITQNNAFVAHSRSIIDSKLF